MADYTTFVSSHDSARTAAHWGLMGLAIGALVILMITLTAAGPVIPARATAAAPVQSALD